MEKGNEKIEFDFIIFFFFIIQFDYVVVAFGRPWPISIYINAMTSQINVILD